MLSRVKTIFEHLSGYVETRMKLNKLELEESILSLFLVMCNVFIFIALGLIGLLCVNIAIVLISFLIFENYLPGVILLVVSYTFTLIYMVYGKKKIFGKKFMKRMIIPEGNKEP